jgi:hypothetical protein
MQPAKMLAPKMLPKMAPRLCFEGLRDTPLPSKLVPLVGLEETESAVVEDEGAVMSASIVDEDDCGP